VNLDAVELEHERAGERFEARVAALGPLAGMRKLGAQLTVVPPGKRAWPYHAHLVNEELVVVLAGSGTLRLADRELPLRAGDVVALVPGREHPHQIVNTSDAELRYLCVSTMEHPDVVLYPDSGKYGVRAGVAPGGDPARSTFRVIARLDAGVDYWDGEI
ncbi:MAG: cupin domain-containing protein, partial [Rubrivivax sp.]